MPKRKSSAQLLPWLSAKPIGRERRFIQVGNSLLLSSRFQELGIGARFLYLCMAMECGGRRRFLIPQSAAKKYGLTPSSFWRYVRELEAAGFLKVSSGKNLRQPNIYEFRDCWKPSLCPPGFGRGMAISSISMSN